ncbi:MAG: Anthranilate synthase component 1 [Cenarchaeum symbiont of Oopsacas minuta]|nr:Anthranilate synthase component 1 [Cenarchaeum symbiont of Oopsacas minuta]
MNTFGQKSAKYIPLNNSATPFEIYKSISENYDHSFLFESLAGPNEMVETTIMGFDPDSIIYVYSDSIVTINRDGKEERKVVEDPFSYIREILGRTDDDRYRYAGGAVGVVNYDAIGLWEKVAHCDLDDKPIMEFGVYTDGIVYDHAKRKPFYFYHKVDRYEELETGGKIGKFFATKPKSLTDLKMFSKMVERAKKYVIAGDIFQVVLSRRYTFETKGDPLQVYQKLRTLNPSPYLYHIKTAKRTIIGASPEMLLRVDNDTVETFPIAGTCKVTNSVIENKRLKEEMVHSEKEIAEHTMLVDLGRNDVGRVCIPGSINVKELMKVKQFSHVQHMVSHVSGKLAENKDMFNAFSGIFPAGTVSGAPKVRAMEIIDELESVARGPYAGTVGYFSFNGCCDFAITIRSIFFEGQKGFIQAGAGIVYDSDAKSEFEETEHKVGAMLDALTEASE